MALITSSEVKKNTSMGGNVDSDKFMHLIYDIQIMVLENVLGTTLYDKIVTDFNEGGSNNLSGDYLVMFNDYIKPVLWHSTFAEYLRDGIILASNGGIITHNPNDGSPSDLENIKWVAKNAQSKADVYIDRLIKFLVSKQITEYIAAQTNDYDRKTDKNINTLGGWYL